MGALRLRFFITHRILTTTLPTSFFLCQCNLLAYRFVSNQIEQSQVKPHPFREINLYMIRTRDFNRVLGGLHIRFHDIFEATPDHGMELFELSRTVYLNFNQELEKFPITERRLTENARWFRF